MRGTDDKKLMFHNLCLWLGRIHAPVHRPKVISLVVAPLGPCGRGDVLQSVEAKKAQQTLCNWRVGAVVGDMYAEHSVLLLRRVKIPLQFQPRLARLVRNEIPDPKYLPRAGSPDRKVVPATFNRRNLYVF